MSLLSYNGDGNFTSATFSCFDIIGYSTQAGSHKSNASFYRYN